MFFEPPETPYDMRWNMLGVYVRVNPWFWVMSALLGQSALHEGFEYLLLWIGCVFVSILCHELGHVFMGRLFGADGYIVLFSFGGLAVGSSNLRSRWQRILVYLAGPLAQLLIVGVVWGAMSLRGDRELAPLAKQAVFNLTVINLYWALLNLVPILPLDGGRVSLDTCNWLTRGRGDYPANVISFLCAGFLTINAIAGVADQTLIPYLPRGIWPAILFGVLAFNSFTALQRHNR